jgi:hypothetical protein
MAEKQSQKDGRFELFMVFRAQFVAGGGIVAFEPGKLGTQKIRGAAVLPRHLSAARLCA